MSSIGYRSVQLQAEYREKLRRQKIRNQARSLIKACQKTIRNIKDPKVQQLAGSSLENIQQQLNFASRQLKQSPESALSTVRNQQGYLNDAIARAESEARRLRFEEMKKQASNMLAGSKDIIRGISDPAVQQMTASGLREIQQQMKDASRQIQSDPKRAREKISQLQRQLKKIISDAQNDANEYSKKQVQSLAQLQSVRQSLEAEQEDENQASREVLVEAKQQIDKASLLYKDGQFKEVSSLCSKASKLIKQAGEKAFDETIRREVVSGLLSTLTNMGFVVDGPVLEGQNPQTGVVRLTGKMPSGKMATFNVNLDGRMEFDFEGYKGRACAKELETIDKTLQEQFALKLGPAQVTWKNPDRIAKGALNLPSGNSHTANH